MRPVGNCGRYCNHWSRRVVACTTTIVAYASSLQLFYDHSPTPKYQTTTFGGRKTANLKCQTEKNYDPFHSAVREAPWTRGNLWLTMLGERYF